MSSEDLVSVLCSSIKEGNVSEAGVNILVQNNEVKIVVLRRKYL